MNKIDAYMHRIKTPLQAKRCRIDALRALAARKAVELSEAAAAAEADQLVRHRQVEIIRSVLNMDRDKSGDTAGLPKIKAGQSVIITHSDNGDVDRIEVVDTGETPIVQYKKNPVGWEETAPIIIRKPRHVGEGGEDGQEKRTRRPA